MSTLSQLSTEAAELEQLLSLIDPTDQNSLTLLHERLDELETELPAKIDAWYFNIKRMKSDIQFIKEQKDAYASIQNTLESRLKASQEYMLMLHSLGKIKSKLQGNAGIISITDNSVQSVETGIDASQWGDEWAAFREVRVEYKARKDAIAQAYNDGLPIPPGCKVSRGQHIRVTPKRSKS